MAEVNVTNVARLADKVHRRLSDFAMFSATSQRRLTDDDRAVIDRFRRASPGRVEALELTLPLEDPWEGAARQRRESGFWPISFSYPRAPVEAGRRRRLLSRVYPGVPYGFKDERRYLAEYRSAHWAVTHRKGGWDCFRHLEILFSGALPLMLDAEDIPPAAMVLYPRRALARLALEARARGPFIAPSAARLLTRYAADHLSTDSMARYLLRAVGYRGGPVMFVDKELRQMVGYLSVSTLIGLKQVLGQQVLDWRSVPYIYQGHRGSTLHLYGRGFGYSRVLPLSTRRDDEVGQPMLSDRDFVADVRRVRPGLIVFGSVTRAPYELMLWQGMPASVRPPAAVLFGSDSGPTDPELRLLRGMGAEVFIRESNDDLGRAA